MSDPEIERRLNSLVIHVPSGSDDAELTELKLSDNEALKRRMHDHHGDWKSSGRVIQMPELLKRAMQKGEREENEKRNYKVLQRVLRLECLCGVDGENAKTGFAAFPDVEVICRREPEDIVIEDPETIDLVLLHPTKGLFLFYAKKHSKEPLDALKIKKHSDFLRRLSQAQTPESMPINVVVCSVFGDLLPETREAVEGNCFYLNADKDSTDQEFETMWRNEIVGSVKDLDKQQKKQVIFISVL